MIMYLYCILIAGHDFDFAMQRKYIWVNLDGNEEYYPQAFCKRCKKYRTL